MIVRNKDIQGGQPCLDGTRMPVESVRNVYHAGGRALVKDYYPHLTDAQIDTAMGGHIRYAWLRCLDFMSELVEETRWYRLGYALLFVANGFLLGWLLT